MKVYGYRVFSMSVLSFMLLLATTACGPDDSSGQPKQSATSTPIVPAVPKVDTPSPAPAYPTATGDDLQLISQAITNTTAANLKSFHYVMTYTMPLFPTTVTEGDYVQGVGTYAKVTQEGSVDETLTEGNTSYCRDTSGKWIVRVPDLRAHFAQSEATVQARMAEDWKKNGFPGTPQPMLTASYDSYLQASQHLIAGFMSLEMRQYDFSYAGEDAVEGTATRRYVGTFAWGRDLVSQVPSDIDGTPMPPDAATEIAKLQATAVANVKRGPLDTLSIWVEPAGGYVRKLERVFEFAPPNTSSNTGSGSSSNISTGTITSAFLVAYSYGCGVDPTGQPTPTMPTMPQSGESVTTILITRLNDPSITLPTP